MEQWIDFASFEIDNNAVRWIGPRLGMGAFDKEVILSVCIKKIYELLRMVLDL